MTAVRSNRKIIVVIAAIAMLASGMPPSAVDAILKEIRPGEVVTLSRVFDVIDRATRKSMLFLTVSCGDEKESTEILIIRNAVQPVYHIKVARMGRANPFPAKSTELDDAGVRKFVSEQRSCGSVSLIQRGGGVDITLDNEGRVASISRTMSALSPSATVPSPSPRP